MYAHGLRTMLSRRNVAPFTLFFLLAVVVVFGFAQSSATADGGRGQRPPFPSDEELKKDFNDDDLKTKDDKPGGKWTYTTLLDSKQRNDPSVPAYVRSIQLVSGGGKYLGIHKIKRVEVTNRSSKTVVLVQVRVEVLHKAEVSYFDENEKVLLEEVLPFANASVAPNASQVVEIKTIHPPRMLKALARNGELYGHFGIRITTQEVRFADGSFWRESEPAALLNSPYLDHSLSFRFPDLASLAIFISPALTKFGR